MIETEFLKSLFGHHYQVICKKPFYLEVVIPLERGLRLLASGGGTA
jgi:hypothetical protein